MERPKYIGWEEALRHIPIIEEYISSQGIAFEPSSGLAVALEKGKKILEAERDGTVDQLFNSPESGLYREDAHTVMVVGGALEMASNHPSCSTIMGKICMDPEIRSSSPEKSEAKEHLVELKTLAVLCHPKNRDDYPASYEYSRRNSGKTLDFIVNGLDELLGIECKHPYSFNGLARAFDDANDKFEDNEVHGVVIVGASDLVEDPNFYDPGKVPVSKTEKGLMGYLRYIIDETMIVRAREVVYRKLHGSRIDGALFDIDYLAAVRRPGKAYPTSVSIDFANILAGDPKVQEFIESTLGKYDKYYISESYHRLYKVFDLWQRPRE